MQSFLLIARMIEAYLLIGFGFAIWFSGRGAGRLDPLASHGSGGFRLLIAPAAMLLWPYLIARILRRGPAR